MNKVLGLFTLFIFCSVISHAQSYPLRYSSENVTNGAGEDYTEKVYELGAAIQLDAAKVKPFVGGKIQSIKIGTISSPEQGDITTAKDLKVFIRSTLTGENLYVQDVDGFSLQNLGGWYEVTLNKPFELDGKDIFIGYTLTANSVPLGFDGNKNPDSRATWVGVNGSWISYTGSGNACIQAMVASDKLVHKKVLLEHFTTAKCNNCPAVHTMLDEMVGSNSDVVWVAHHSGFFTDDYTTDVDTKYLAFFNGSAYAPAIMYDRVNLSGYGAVDGSQASVAGPVFFPGTKELTEGLLSVRSALPSFVKVDMDGTYTSDSHKLTVTVHGKVLIPELLGASPTINVFLTESGLVGSQSGANGSYTHNRVFRTAITGPWGEALEVGSDGAYSKTYEYVLDEKWVPENMSIVAFISNVDTKDVNNCEVYNVNTIKMTDSFSGIEATQRNDIAVYANSSSIIIDGNHSAVCIYDYTGKLLKALGSDVNSCQMEKGIYLVKVMDGEHTFVKKIVVN